MEALGDQIKVDTELLDRRILSVCTRCFAQYKLPIEMSKITPAFHTWARRHGIDWISYMDQAEARGVVHIQQLPTGKRLIYARADWDRLTEAERSEIQSRLLYIYVKKGHRFQSQAFKNAVEVSKGRVSSYPYDEIPKFFTKSDKEEPSDQ